MIIDRNTHIYMQSTLYPNKNWTDNENYYVIDETKEENQELINKIKEHAPYMELVIENNKLIDVIPTDQPPAPEPEIVDEYVDEEKVAMAEAIIDLESRLTEIEKIKGGNI
ncbi:hypothetical protein ACR77J_16035 [Tissierella praeacuta]|uniref:hypothetical protein n=1 Tax=Tissierella praeacuta TaxID=43131 RepID=UPI003DA47425